MSIGRSPPSPPEKGAPGATRPMMPTKPPASPMLLIFTVKLQSPRSTRQSCLQGNLPQRAHSHSGCRLHRHRIEPGLDDVGQWDRPGLEHDAGVDSGDGTVDRLDQLAAPQMAPGSAQQKARLAASKKACRATYGLSALLPADETVSTPSAVALSTASERSSSKGCP